MLEDNGAIVIHGIKNIPKVIIRKLPGNIIKKDGNYINKESWVLDTIGTNLLDVLSLDIIDKIANTISNSSGITLLDVDSGADTNRTVITFVGRRHTTF